MADETTDAANTNTDAATETKPDDNKPDDNKPDDTKPESTEEEKSDATTSSDTQETPPDTPVELKAADYKLPKGWPDSIKEMAEKGSMTQDQLTQTVNYFSGYFNDLNKATVTQLKEAGKKFIETWGDDSEYNLGKAKQAVDYINEQIGDNKFVDYLKKSNQQHHPIMIDALLHVSNLMQEGSFIPSNVNRSGTKGKTLAQLMYGEKHPSKTT